MSSARNLLRVCDCLGFAENMPLLYVTVFSAVAATQVRAAQIASSLVQTGYAETAEQYFFRGMLTAAAQVGTSPQNNQWPVKNFPANPDQDWKFTVSFVGDGFESVTDPFGVRKVVVRNAGLVLNPVDVGLHIPAPHADENANNELPALSTRTTNMTDGTHGYSIGPPASQEHFEYSHSVFTWGSVRHGTKHRDYYAISSPLSVFTNGGTTTLEATNLNVFAAHTKHVYFTDDEIHELRKETATALGAVSSGSLDDPVLQYDAETRSLTLSPARINVLDRVGGDSRGVAAEFGGDALADAMLEISALEVFSDADGTFALSGGEVRITAAEAGIQFAAQFDQLFVDADNRNGLQNFAVLGSGGGRQMPQDASDFMSLFIAEHVLPADFAAAELTPLGLTLTPAMSLSEATAGFTRSAAIGVDILIGGLTLPVELSADFNGDGFVDGIDFLIWQTNFGVPAPTAGDANHDQAVDGLDFLIWQQSVGTHSDLTGRGSAARVPEPTAALLCGMLMLSLPLARR